jgi:hypothetical protein
MESHRSRHLIVKLFSCMAAVIGAAGLTLVTMMALVRTSIMAVSIATVPFRIVAVAADALLGTVLLVACIYLATHLAVRTLGVGQAEFPPLPEDSHQAEPPKY